MQETDLSGSLQTSNVEPAIQSVSSWFARQTNGHWFDSSASQSDLVDTSAATASDVRLDVPSSPHRQDRQLFASTADRAHVRYPVTRDGPYARIPLPHPYVQSIDVLNVRQRSGGVEDWVAASDVAQGRGEDYYTLRRGQNSYGKTYLYVRASSIGARTNYDGLLTVEYSHGLDEQTESWSDVRRGVANLAAAQLVTDDNVLESLPDQGQLIGVDTQRDQHVGDAIGEAWSHLSPYLTAEVR